jgi:hypothetical protein
MPAAKVTLALDAAVPPVSLESRVGEDAEIGDFI